MKKQQKQPENLNPINLVCYVCNKGIDYLDEKQIFGKIVNMPYPGGWYHKKCWKQNEQSKD